MSGKERSIMLLATKKISAGIFFRPDDFLVVRSFAGDEWAHAAIMAGRQAGQAANDRYRKTQKKNTELDEVLASRFVHVLLTRISNRFDIHF